MYHSSINEQLVRNPYTLPRICEIMQQLEGLQDVTVLYLNMGYYTIKTLPANQEMMTIVTELSKFRYKCLPMSIYVFGDIF